MLYQRLGARLKGFAQATPQTLFRKFVNTPSPDARYGNVIENRQLRSGRKEFCRTKVKQ
jgi:hypothetical protein